MMKDDPVNFTPPIKVMKIRPEAKIPKAAYYGDACLDLAFAPADGKPVWIRPGETLKLETGLAFEIPVGWEGLVRSRSGLAAKEDILVLNSPGTVDSGYRGEIYIILHKAASVDVARFGGIGSNFKINPGDRLAQICFKTVYAPLLQEVKELGPATRGANGLGSTGV